MLVNPSDIDALAKATITECSVTEIHDCLNSNILLIDIREPAEYQRGHIPGAVLLPRGLLDFELHRLVEKMCADMTISPEEQPIVLYCGTGGRSSLAALSVEALGYGNVKSMAGGIVAWAQAQLPVSIPDR